MSQRIEIGTSLYLFTSSAMGPRGGNCVIACHGARAMIPHTFKVPTGVRVHFYVDKNYSLGEVISNVNNSRNAGSVEVIALSDRLIADYQPQIKESYQPGDSKCPNYSFAKDNDYHASQGAGMRSQDILSFLDAYPEAWDIVTVRYRYSGLGSEPDLKSVIHQLKKGNLAYTTFHCSFCRPPVFKNPAGVQHVGPSIRSGWDGTFTKSLLSDGLKPKGTSF